MNITALRPRFMRYIEPLAGLFIRAGLTPNQISLLSLIAGIACAVLYAMNLFLAGSIMLILSAILDLIDGSVARRIGTQSDFGAVIDWIVDKYVDSLVLLGIGFSSIAIVSHIYSSFHGWDWVVITLAIFGSMMNTFIKPVVYAEIGYSERVAGKIEDPLEGVGFFGRPETILFLIAGGLSGYLWISVIVIALCTNISALQRIVYLYKRLKGPA
ncbi:MAG: CDP-alcohol phosphatidyltransferase family protein [Methanomicrobiales archaeon]|nr:CDP-alcohol phosphatidyltransferase family protein [Methanomicrobiales archaeon]